MTLNLNVSPYFDDYDVNKGYLKILFKPGNSVQARELTQIQSILQQQVGNLSDHFFKEGAMVIPGQSALDLKANYVKVDLPSNLSSATDFVGKILQGKKTGIRALVVKHADAVDLNNDNVIDYTNDEPTTLYLKYLDGTAEQGTVVDSTTIDILEDGTATFTVNGQTVTLAENVSSTFVEGEELFAAGTDGVNYTATVLTSTQVSLPIGIGSLAYIEEGFYYVKKHLVKVSAQSIILDKYTNAPNYRIGLEVVESIQTFNEDSSLYDNALGTSNYNAPGADRYKIQLNLIKKDYNVIDTSNFIELIAVRNGALSNYVTTTDYSQLLKTLARRTYDESGDYTVRPFKIDIREYFNEDDNGGVYSMPDFAFDTEVAAKEFALQNFSTDLGMVSNNEGLAHTISLVDRQTYPNQTLDTTGTKYYPGLTHLNLLDAVRDKLAIGLESGKAYVRGYEIERKPASNRTKYIAYDRSRDNYQINNHYMPINLGSYVYATDMKGLPEIDEKVKLVNVHTSNTGNVDFFAVNPNIDLGSDAYFTSITYDEDSTFFQGGGTSLGTNIYGIDVIANAKVKAVKYYEDSSNSAKSNNYSGSTFKPDSSSSEVAIYKVYLYDIEYEINPRTNAKYNISDARSFVSESTVSPAALGGGTIYKFGGNILTELLLTNVEGNFTDRSLIFEKFNNTTRAINYHYNALLGQLLVKPLNSGNMEIGSEDSGTQLPSANITVNEVINEGVVSASSDAGANAFLGTSTSVDVSSASARVFSKAVLHQTSGSSIIPTGKLWVTTVRNIDDISGSTTVDTQYTVMKKFENLTSGSVNGLVTLTISDANTLFDTTNTSLYEAFTLATASRANGQVGVLSGFNPSTDRQTISFNVSNIASGTTGIIVYAPVVKTESKEKVKTIVTASPELPFTLEDKQGASISQAAYDNTAGANNDSSPTYGQDILGISSSVTTGAVNPTFTVGANDEVQLSLSELQMKNSDIKELKKLYDTCNVNNVAYRVGVIASDKKFIHEMTETEFEFAENAYNFYEQTGTSPFNVNLDPGVTTSLAALETLLVVSGVSNPFAADLRTAYTNGQLVSNPTEVPVKINDITSRYELFNGHKPSIIQLGQLNLKPGNLPCGGRPVIIYTYYSHGVGDYASVDSYVDGYNTIGSFAGQRLSDVLDFRPSVTYQQTTGLPIGTGVISNVSEYPIDSSAISADLRVYLGRKDKLYMNKFGKVKVKYGTPAEEPIMPENPDDGMVLYELESRPFTLNPLSVSVKMLENKRYTMRDIGKLEKRIQNLEYYTSLNLLEKDTMDLSIKDENGNDRFKNGFIVDSFVDHTVGNPFDPDYRISIDKRKGEMRPFFSEKIMNMKINYLSSRGFEIKEGKIYLPYTSTYLITQEKSSKTINVNPYAIFSFRGSVTLFPSTDEWKETNQLPDIVTDRREEYDNVYGSLGEEGVLGTVWNEWEENWSGVSEEILSTSSQTVTRANANPDIVTPIVASAGLVRRETTTEIETTITSQQSRSGLGISVSPRDFTENLGPLTISTEIIPYIRARTVFFEAEKLRPSTKVYAFFDGVNVTEFCSRTTKLITTDTPSASSNFLQGKENGVHRKEGIPRDFRGRAVIKGGTSGATAIVYKIEYISVFSFKFHLHSNSETAGFISGENIFLEWPSTETDTQTKGMGTWVTPTGANLSTGDLVTDNAGRLSGLFDIPNTSNLKFKTGERIFRLSDQPSDSSENETEAQGIYTASGVIESQSDQILMTRVPEFSFREDTQEDTITDVSINEEVTAGGWYDPLAQTIMIKEDGGCFITAVEIFFSTKDDAKPVECQIRETVNGYPGPKILGKKFVYPADVAISDDGTLPTEFVFPSPIYVRDETEYCIVLLADTQGYRAHIARLGEESLDGSGVISEQPYAGVFFKSQNASTWTADQMEDMKFRVSKAVFETQGSHEIYLENSEKDDNGNDLWTERFRTNGMKTTDNSTEITFTVFDTSGMVPTRFWRSNGYNYVILGNFHGTYDVFPSESLNGAHLVTDTTYNSFTIDLRNPFYPMTGSVLSNTPQVAYSGASLPTTDQVFTPSSNTIDRPYFKSNFKYDTIKPIIQKIELPNTRVTFGMRGLSGTSQDSAIVPGVKDSSYVGFIPNNNMILSSPKMVTTNFNEQQFSTASSAIDKKSLVFKINMESEQDNLSPVIDTERMSSILVSNKTNSPQNIALGNLGHVNTGFVDETSASGGSVSTKYMTREITLDQPASSLRVLASVSRREGCDVDFYYRLKSSEDEIFSKLAYTLIPRTSIYNTASVSEDDFKEFDFDVRPLPEFTSVSVKIVLKTNNSSVVPKVKDLRVIALAS